MGQPADELRYPLFMFYLDLDELPELFDGMALCSARRAALAYFRRADYLGDPSVPLKEAVWDLVADRTGSRPAGPVRLLTHIRCFGHCFNPVSFYYCFDEAGERIVAVVADVTNTPWGERHAYVMGVDQSTDHGSLRLMRGEFSKQLHVSPLMSMDHVYDWRLSEPARELIVHIASHRTGGELAFDATLSLRQRALSPRTLADTLMSYPFLSMRIMARIYGHALRLKLRGATYFPHPDKGVPCT
jgi:DUF1365 family protein